MSDNYAVSLKRVDFSRTVEITVLDKRNPAKKFVMSVSELHLDDVEEMLQAILDRLRASKKDKDVSVVERLQEFFEEGVLKREVSVPTKADTSKLDAVFGNVVPAIEQISKWRQRKTPLPETTVHWGRPLIRKHKGRPGTFECFPIGVLAEALQRVPVTIRSWEDKKIFPKPTIRDEPPLHASLPSKVAKGKRLYTRAQIEAAVAAAKVSGVYDPDNRNANWAEFTRLVKAAWAEL